MRLFIGISFEGEVQNKLIKIQKQVSEAVMKGRFYNSKNFHLTLRFIGETSQKFVPDIRTAMEEAVENLSPFELVIDHLGRFQKRNRNILWLGAQNNSIVEKLHEELNDQLENRINLEPTTLPFTPHITLGRNIQIGEDWEEFKEKIFISKMITKVSTITLFQSTQVEGELRYLPIEVVYLNNRIQN